MTQAYKLQRDGDEFLYTFASIAIAIGVTGLFESHHDLYGQVVIRSSLPDQSGLVHKSRLNLDSARSRATLLPELKKRIPDVPWADVLETVCVRTEEEYRAGAPTINLAIEEAQGEMTYLVKPLLSENSVTIFFGDGGVGKSWLAMMLALAVQTGGKLPGGMLLKGAPRNVMYLDWESQRRWQVLRMGALALGMGVTWPERFWYREQQRSIVQDAVMLRAEVSKREIGLVVIDSIGPATAGSLREEELAIPVMNAIRGLGCTVLALAHISKEAAKESNGKATPLGSVMYANLARSTWEVRRSEDSPEGVLQLGLYHRKSNQGALEQRPIGMRLEFLEQNGTMMVTPRGLDLGSVDELSARGSLAFRLQNALRQGGMTTAALAEELNAKEDVVRTTLGRRKDLFLKLGDGGGRGNQTTWGLLANDNP